MLLAGTVARTEFLDQALGVAWRNTRTELNGRFNMADTRPTSSVLLIEVPNAEDGLIATAELIAG